jgi:hypothetical protein
VQIYNFNRATEKLALKGYRLIIMAGYREGGSFGQIFDGSILQSFTNRQGQDWVWEAVAVSGGYVSDMVIGSLGAGGSQREELGFIADQIGAGTGETTERLGSSGRLARGKVLFGSACDYLQGLASESDSFFKIDEKGDLCVINLADEVPPGQAVSINQSNGLIGSPTYSDEGMQISMLLNPRVRLGGLVKINNADVKRNALEPGSLGSSQRFSFDVDGEYRAASVLHEGDTHGDAWRTTIIGYSQSRSVILLGQEAIL